jgi:hypothetical protein
MNTLTLQNLRERCMAFILHHFDEISRTAGFEEMGRTNVELGTYHAGFPLSPCFAPLMRYMQLTRIFVVVLIYSV